MRLHRNKFLTTVAAAALALAVGACSSSSDDDETVAAAAPPPATTEPAPEPTPTPELTPAEQLAAAEAAVVAAQALVAALTNSSTADEASAAYAALGAAQAALHAANSMPANQIAELQAQINQLVLDLKAANATPSTETVALEQAQADAVTAATEAMEAATAAKVASDAAQTAIENLATLQTGETSRDLAHAAYMQSKAAAAAEAQTASDDAAEATDGVAATRLLVMAETARDNAVAAQGMAETQGAAAVVAAMAELKIDGTVKTVGGTSIDATAGSTVVTVGEGNDAQTTRTGLLEGMAPETTGDGVEATAAVTGVQDDPDTEGNQAMKHVQAVADRTFPIGKVVDSDDDTARLMIVTKYAGSKTAYVYNLGADEETGTKAGYININDGDADNNNDAQIDVNNVRLKSEGTFYAAGEAGTGEGTLTHESVVLAATKPVEVFSYVACLSGYHPHPLYVVCLLGLQARAGAGALRRRSG